MGGVFYKTLIGPLSKGKQGLWTTRNKEGQILSKGSPEEIQSRIKAYKHFNQPKSPYKTVNYDISKADIWHDKKDNTIYSRSLFAPPSTWKSPHAQAFDKGKTSDVKTRSKFSKDRRPFARGRII
ncbi:hypothetical protein CMI37_20040 [Candidatus Pacearchaeota archaeon]|nr:hypothetical protein [Candidatus Pacearchaeota archaeon]|tara:strand:+ start:512 stop:886 length:375 start_codon:yes stop_codon:yes gene_type:complete